MANYGNAWTLPPSFMPCNGGFKKGAMAAAAAEPPEEISVMKQSRNAEVGALENHGRDDGILCVTIHQAKYIHNICIYGDQNVYARFSLTHREDMVYPTQPVKAGGQNAVFNQTFEIPVSGQDTVLKCEIWMMSCRQDLLEDQLLGFVLVPLKNLYGRGKQTNEYCLTATDLFDMPAGTVHLSLLFLDANDIAARGKFLPSHENKVSFCSPASSGFQEVVMDCCQQNAISANECKVEFLNLETAAEDQRLVSMYHKMANGGCFEECNESSSLFLHTGTVENVDEHAGLAILPEKSHAMCNRSSEIKEPFTGAHSMNMHSALEGSSKLQGTSKAGVMEEVILDCVEMRPPRPEQVSTECSGNSSSLSVVNEMKQKSAEASFACEADRIMPDSAPPMKTSTEPEATLSQEHFVDLYLKSMQQFSDKLEDIKFSFDIDPKDLAALRSVQLDRKTMEGRNREGSKLYYGSRVFY